MWQLKIRGWHLVAGLLAIVAVGAGIAVWVQGRRPLDPARMAGYFPAREATVAYIDFSALRDSGVLEKLVGPAVTEEPDYRAFVQQVGFDYRRDLDRVMVNSAAGVHYFLVEGRFDWQKLSGYAKQQGGSCTDDTCSLKGSTPDRVISFRLMNPKLLAMASAKEADAVKVLSARTPDKPLFEIPQKPFWVHLPAEAIRGASQLPSGTRLFARALEPATRAVFALGPAQNAFELTADITCKSVEEAATLRSQLEDITGLLHRLISREKQAPNASDLSGVLSSGKFERQQERVIARWPIPREFIDALGKS